MEIQILKQIGIALGLALLVGLERERKYQIDQGKSFGGVRTFALLGLTGVLTQILLNASELLAAVLGFGVMGMLLVSYFVTAKKSGRAGITSELGAVMVFIIGILCGQDRFLLAVSLTLIVAVMLHFKEPLHDWAKKITKSELIAAFQFVLIAFVVLPILPDQNLGPYGFFNPHTVWLMVVLISGLSFLSYIAIRILGTKKGIGVTGFLAGFISSTALALSFSGESKKNKQIVSPYVVAIIVASSAMFFRVLIEVFVVNPNLLPTVIVPILAMGIAGLASVVFFWLNKEKIPADLKTNLESVKSPLSLSAALKFGLFFVVISFLTKFAGEFLGNRGIYLTSFVSGILDVDAITVSVANLTKNGVIDEFVGAAAISIAAMTNTIVKAVILMLFGSRKVAIRTSAAFGLIVIVGLISLYLVYNTMYY